VEFSLTVNGNILISSAIRNQDVFGEDAHTFDPERWLQSGIKRSTNVGVLANLYVSALTMSISMNYFSHSRLGFFVFLFLA